MGAIGFGAGPRPVGAGRVKPRRVRRIDVGVLPKPSGGGDVRGMRNVGGYSMPGFREIPPIDRDLAAVGAMSEGDEAVAADPAAR